MNQLTVGGIGARLSEYLLRFAEEEGISPGEAVLRLLHKAAGLPESPPAPREKIGKSLDHFVGSMTKEESDELREAWEFFHRVDESKWQ